MEFFMEHHSHNEKDETLNGFNSLRFSIQCRNVVNFYNQTHIKRFVLASLPDDVEII